MSFDYFEHINELMESDPLKAIESLERHEGNLLNKPIDLHFAYNQMIDLYYRHRNNELLLNKCVDVCKRDIELTPKVINLMKNDIMFKHYDESGELVFTPPRFPSFQRLTIIYDKQGKYGEAIKICENALMHNLKDGTKGGFEGRIERLKRKINNPPKAKKPISKAALEKHSELKDTSIEVANNQLSTIENSFMITFSKSTSSNFDRALFLAKQADNFIITTHNNQEIYQAEYYSENYLNFITLYELIGNWKSTFVFKDGEMIDRKVLGQINYCYGDKLRSHSDAFCFGASMFTENPFGCHRLMIHSGQRPWYEWRKGEDNRYIYIDKEAMRRQIDEKTVTYRTCPAFNYNSIINVLNELPNRIDKKSQLYKDLYTRHSDGTITIKVDIEDEAKKSKRAKAPGLKNNNTPVGCSSLFIIPVLILLLNMIL